MMQGAAASAPVERLYPGGPEVVSDDESSVEDDLSDLSNLGSLGGGEDYMQDALN
jgi:hypothetical protein